MATSDARGRQVALALHGLAAADRNRVLELLGETYRQRLQPVLAELQSLGIPATLSAPAADVAAQADRGASVQARLASLPTEAVVFVLDQSLPEISAVLLGAVGGDWSAATLQAMQPSRQRAVQSALAAGCQAGPRLIEALCARLFDMTVNATLATSPAVVRADAVKRPWSWRR